MRRRRETFRDLDIIATSTDAPALIELLHDVAVGRGGRRQGRHEGDRDLERRPPLRPARRPARVVREPAPALHGLEGPQRRAARGRASGAASRSPSTASPPSRPARSFTAEDEEELYAHLGYALHPARAARERRRARGGAARRRCPSSSSAATCAATCTRTRPGRTARPRSRRWRSAARALGHEYLAICDHAQRLRDGRLEPQWEEIDALNERLAPFRVLKGIEVNIRANGELDVADELLAQLDWVMASVHTSFDKDPTGRVLAAMESPHVDCIGHLTSRKIGKRGPSDDRGREGGRAGARDRHVPRDQLAAGPARPARRPRSAGRRGGPPARRLERRPLGRRRSATSTSGSPRRAAPG